MNAVTTAAELVRHGKGILAADESVSTMNDAILPLLRQAGIARTKTRLWSAHYGLGEHICGPGSCGLLSIDADGTQWTSSALGLVLDQSLLLEDFFTTQNPTAAEAELQSGQLNTGHGVFTVMPATRTPPSATASTTRSTRLPGVS